MKREQIINKLNLFFNQFVTFVTILALFLVFVPYNPAHASQQYVDELVDLYGAWIILPAGSVDSGLSFDYTYNGALTNSTMALPESGSLGFTNIGTASLDNYWAYASANQAPFTIGYVGWNEMVDAEMKRQSDLTGSVDNMSFASWNYDSSNGQFTMEVPLSKQLIEFALGYNKWLTNDELGGTSDTTTDFDTSSSGLGKDFYLQGYPPELTIYRGPATITFERIYISTGELQYRDIISIPNNVYYSLYMIPGSNASVNGNQYMFFGFRSRNEGGSFSVSTRTYNISSGTSSSSSFSSSYNNTTYFYINRQLNIEFPGGIRENIPIDADFSVFYQTDPFISFNITQLPVEMSIGLKPKTGINTIQYQVMQQYLDDVEASVEAGGSGDDITPPKLTWTIDSLKFGTLTPPDPNSATIQDALEYVRDTRILAGEHVNEPNSGYSQEFDYNPPGTDNPGDGGEGGENGDDVQTVDVIPHVFSFPFPTLDLKGIWYYVVQWVRSISTWMTTMFNVWSGLPVAMVYPVWATAVIVIVIGVYRRFFM